MKNIKSLTIIGSSGMVGSDLMRYLNDYFQEVVGVDRDNYNQYRGHRSDVVINANGNSNKIWANGHILEDFEASTVSVYKTLLDFSCKIYIYISSADVYPDYTDKKFTSETKTIDPKNLSPYGFHKYLSECIVKNFMKNYIILRCPMILGTNLKKGPIYDILHNLPLFVSEKSAFQMISTEEIARIINFLIAQDITQEIFNIGGTEVVSLSKINEFTGQPVKFKKDNKTYVYKMNTDKINNIYKLKTSKEYLNYLLKSYKKNYNH